MASANTDTVSVIDTTTNREMVRLSAGLGDGTRTGGSTQALALSANERVLFVASAQTQSVAVVSLGADVFPSGTRDKDDDDGRPRQRRPRAASRVVGFVPTARYPSALAMVGAELFIGNGKGEAAARPNAPTAEFPANPKLRGAYAPSLDPQQSPAPDGSRSGSAGRHDHARAAGERTRRGSRRAPVRGAVAHHARDLHHQGEPHVRPGVRRHRRCRETAPLQTATHRSRCLAAVRRRAGRAGRRRTSRRTTERWRSASGSSIASSSTRRRAPTDTTGPPPRSRPTTWTRPSGGPTRVAVDPTTTKASTGCRLWTVTSCRRD